MSISASSWSVPGAVEAALRRGRGCRSPSFGDEREHDEQRQRDDGVADPVRAHAGLAAARPPGRTRRTTASSSTTERSPMPDGGVVVRELLDERDEHGGERRAADRAEAADHDDDEGVDQQARAELRIDGAEVERREHAGERGGEPADREDERERAPHVDPERGHHRAVLDARADDQPVARAAQEEAEADEHDGGRRDLDPAVVRDRGAEHAGGLGHPAAAGRRTSGRSPRSRSTSAATQRPSPTVTSTCSMCRPYSGRISTSSTSAANSVPTASPTSAPSRKRGATGIAAELRLR